MTRRPLPRALAVTILLGIAALVAPRAVVACSCFETQPMAVYADEPETVIFTGVTEPRDVRGFPVIVTRWFKGIGIAPRVWMAASGFDGNDGTCGIEPLPVGSEWIFVAYRLPEGGDLIVNLCAPHALVSSPAGMAMLADAQTTFGAGDVAAPTLPPTGPDETTATSGLMAILPAIGVTTLAGLAMILGVYAITSRRRGDGDGDGDGDGEV
jgi:hypothetical protein